jgi:hypothetical protein
MSADENAHLFWALWTVVVLPCYLLLAVVWLVGSARTRDRLRKLIEGPEYGDAVER